MSFWDAIEIGRTTAIGSHRFAAEEIKAFAAKFDPQPFHLDEAAAEASIFGGLCASGWHTAAVFMRFNVKHIEAEVERWVALGNGRAIIGPSPGFRNLRWLRPVHAGDTVSYETTITDKRLSASRPGWGLIETANVGRNQSGDVVFSFDGAAFVGLT